MESTSNNNNEKTETEVPSFDTELEHSLTLYDQVLNVHDVCSVKGGWQIFGTNRKVRGRRIAIIGAFKVGKTRFTRRLSNTVLKDSHTIPTLGLSVKFPPAVMSDTAKKTSAPTKTGIKLAGSMPTKKQPTSNVPTYDAIYLDTAGTDRPCHHKALANYTATEFFLQDYTISLAQRVILVINKFDREAQKNIDFVIKKINNRHPDQKVNSNNRLLVVHNYATVDDMTTLNRKIEEVENTYYDEDDPSSWQQLTLSSDTNKTQYYYTTPNTAHVFLMNDDKCKEENDIALKFIRNYYNNVNIEEFDLLQEFVDTAHLQLENYLQDWSLSYRLRVEEIDGCKVIKPYLLEESVDDYEFDTNEQKEEWLRQRKEDAALLENGEPFQLQPLQYTEVGVIAKTIQDLPGQVFVDKAEKKVVFQIHAPGFTKECKTREKITSLVVKENCYVEMRIKLEEPAKSKNIKRLNNTIAYGVGRYSYKIPQAGENNIRFVQPKSRSEMWSRISIADGIITITMDLEEYDEEEHASNNNNNN